VKLILTVGLLNGLGWAVCQNWQWAARVWPDGHFNFWRCWESSGGISIGIAYGVAYYLANNRMKEPELAEQGTGTDPTLERLGAYLGLLLGLGLSIKNGLKGWCNIYIGNEDHWNSVLWKIVGPLMVLGLLAILVRIWLRPLPKQFKGDAFPHAYRLVWLMLLIQNVIAQLVTGPWSAWNEVAFSIYYLLLFFLSAVILHHYHVLKPRFT
jgi:MFS family permease